MIDHSNCDHPSTSGARAKCRRLKQEPWPRPPLYSLGPPPGAKKASTKTIDDEDRYGQTPRDKADECVKCGVERIAYSGTDSLSGIVLYVGERCRYYIKGAPDEKAVL